MAVAGNYSGDPSSSNKDNVRFLIGDTTDPFLLSDAEINALLTSNPLPQLAAADACDHLVARFSFNVDKRIGNLSISASQRAEAYRKRADDLRADVLRMGLFTPYVGGLSVSEKKTFRSDSDLVQPNTRVGQDDHPSILRDSTIDPRIPS